MANGINLFVMVYVPIAANSINNISTKLGWQVFYKKHLKEKVTFFFSFNNFVALFCNS